MRYMSATAVKTWRSCRYQFRLRYVERRDPGARPPMLVAGDVLHQALGLYAMEQPESEAAALDLLEGVLSRSEDLSPDEIERARLDVAPLLIAYHDRPELHIVPPDAELERDLRVRAGAITLASRADAIYPDDGQDRGDMGAQGIHVVDWKTSAPSKPDIYLQYAFLRAGVRNLHPTGPIRMWMVAVRDLALQEVFMDETTFRGQLHLVFEAARDIAREPSRPDPFPANPGDACGICAYAFGCPHAVEALESVAF